MKQRVHKKILSQTTYKQTARVQYNTIYKKILNIQHKSMEYVIHNANTSQFII